MNNRRTMERHYSEYSDFFSTQREREYERDADLPQRESTQVRWVDGTEDANGTLVLVVHRTTGRSGQVMLGSIRTHSLRTRNSRRVATPSGKSVSREADTRRDGSPQRQSVGYPTEACLSTSDGPDSTTSGSDIPEGHSDRPPEVEYSDKLISGRPQAEGGSEGLCSPSRQLEIAVIRLQKDIDDCRTELELTINQTPAVAPRPPRRSGFTSTPVPRYSGKSNWDQYR